MDPALTKLALIQFVKAIQRETLSAPAEGDFTTGWAKRQKTLEAGERAVSYLKKLPLDDPRLLTIAAKASGPLALARLMPGDGALVPATGPAILDFFAGLADAA
jgi:hypothetical protein